MGSVTVRELFEAMRRRAVANPDKVAISDARRSLTRNELLASIYGLAKDLEAAPRVIGLFAPNSVEWAVALFASALAGKIVVPLPTFFSDEQHSHIVRDAGVELALVTASTRAKATGAGACIRLIEMTRRQDEIVSPVEGFGQIIYTSGSTGRPKGVRHESGQIGWSAAALTEAIGAREDDTYLSVLPLPLLLESICALFAPALVGARTFLDCDLAEAVGRGAASGLSASFEKHRPTTSVLVPQLLKAWVGELEAARRRAPASLRFVAVGGGPTPSAVAEAAWSIGIPVHEGYGLSECCSVVSVNRAGARRPGTVGPPLKGLLVHVEKGEIIVDGPTIMDGYLGRARSRGPWRTRDLGGVDADGYVSVYGRTDNLIVTAFGRNVSAEWVETMLLADPRIGLCGVVGHGEPHLTVFLIPSQRGVAWFSSADAAQVIELIRQCCRGAPDYAVPKVAKVIPLETALASGLVTSNGRIVRSRLAKTAAEFSSIPTFSEREPQ